MTASSDLAVLNRNIRNVAPLLIDFVLFPFFIGQSRYSSDALAIIDCLIFFTQSFFIICLLSFYLHTYLSMCLFLHNRIDTMHFFVFFRANKISFVICNIRWDSYVCIWKLGNRMQEKGGSQDWWKSFLFSFFSFLSYELLVLE